MSGSETLADWLRQQIDRDAEIAEAAGGTWNHECHHVDDNNEWYDDANPHPGCCRVGGSVLIYDEGGHDAADAEHMIRFDPARVLRDVESKRKILDACVGLLDSHTGDCWDGTELAGSVLCALAAPFRGVPGWREEWAMD